MRSLAGIALLLLLAAPPLLAQQACPAAGPPQGALRVTIGHFAEGADDIQEFCRYLVLRQIWPTFVNLGSVADPRAARGAEQALETGRIDVLWVNSHATGTVLQANKAQTLKIAAITDFLVLHVGNRDARAGLVTDSAFAPPAIAVRQGRSAFFADVLMIATRHRPRCLEAAVACLAYAGEGLRRQLDEFLSGAAGRVVMLTSWAFPPKGPDVIVRTLHTTSGFRLVGVPAQTVVAMQPLAGQMAIVEIPRAAYSPTQQAAVPTAAVAQWLLSSTPAEVQARVAQLAVRLNEALLEQDPRLDLDRDLPTALRMARVLSDQLDRRLLLHAEFARVLGSRAGAFTDLPPREPVQRNPRD